MKNDMTYGEAIKCIDETFKTLKFNPFNIPVEFGKACDVAVKAMEEVQEYRKIGTLEECREAVEKTKAKKPKFYATNWYCPVCGNLVGNSGFHWLHDFCEKCGNKIDWSDEE